MTDLTPRKPHGRGLIWPDSVLDLQEHVLGLGLPPLYLVGGAVRDALLSRPIKDLDLATPGPAITIARKITNLYAGDIFVMDREREVARVFIPAADAPGGRLTLDIARFRDGTDDLLADLQARDFTINALAVDLLGDLALLIDPLGGEQDVLDKRIRRCNPQAISSDPIRALRAVRQSVQLTMRIEPETLQDVRAYGPRLNETSPERVRDEFFSLLQLANVAGALRVADRLGMLAVILPEVSNHTVQTPGFDTWQRALLAVEKMRRVLNAISPRRTDATAAAFDMGMLTIQLDRYRKQLNAHIDHAWPNERPHHALLILGTMLHGILPNDATPEARALAAEAAAERAAASADQLRLSNPEKQRLVLMVSQQHQVLAAREWPALAQHRFWYPLGAAGVDACLLAFASYTGAAGNQLKQPAVLRLVDRIITLLGAYFERYEQLVRPAPWLSGNDLMQHFGLQAGPIIGDLLTHLREQQVIGKVENRDDAIAAATAYLNLNA